MRETYDKPSFRETHTLSRSPDSDSLPHLKGEFLAGDDDFQGAMLQGVSRTFALTIPQLPTELCRVVSNGYLLCRIVDTIEDEPHLAGAEKQYFCRQFLRTFDELQSADSFARQLGASLSSNTPAAEHELIHNIPHVLRITESFPEAERDALRHCVRIMAEGMSEFQLSGSKNGVKPLEDLDRYCYLVAGVVGEMMT